MTRTDSDGLHRQHLDHVAPEDEETYLCNLAYTLSAKRSRFPLKTFTSTSSVAQLIENLEGDLATSVLSAGTPGLGFIFTGQCHSKSLGCRWSINAQLSKSIKSSNVNKPAYSQPVSAAVQIALLHLLRN
jgi:hypothetical protein